MPPACSLITIDPGALRAFTVLDVYDPDELGDDSRVSQRFPGYNNYNAYRLRDWGACGARPTGLLSQFAVRRVGALTLASIESRFGTDVGIVGQGVPRLFLTFSQTGAIALQPGPTREALSAGSKGLIYRGLAGTRLLTSDDSSRITLQIDEARLLRALTALLDDTCLDVPSFEPEVDWAAPAVAPIARMVAHMAGEIGDPHGLFSVAPALETFTDTLVHLVLARLPHSYSEQLSAPRRPAIPRQLRRAELFMEAHADQAISITDVAAAAGCGTRALQLAFREFRGTTPLAALRDVRLRAAHAALRASTAPTAEIARKFGFTNPSRFKSAFLRRFGEPPGSGR